MGQDQWNIGSDLKSRNPARFGLFVGRARPVAVHVASPDDLTLSAADRRAVLNAATLGPPVLRAALGAVGLAGWLDAAERAGASPALVAGRLADIAAEEVGIIA